MNVNFFWEDVPNLYWGYFQFHNRLAILSHLQNGHTVTLYYKGKDKPLGQYFPSDLIKYFPSKFFIKDADEIVSIDEFVQTANKNIPPENIVRTASDFWSFHLMKTLDEFSMYCDCDVISLKSFPQTNWIITSDNIEDKHITVGIMKGPKQHPIWDYMISHCRKDWYNVQVFTEAVNNFNLKQFECGSHWFHPKCWKYAYDNPLNVHFLLYDKEIPKDSYGIHYYNYRLSRIKPPLDETFIDKFPKSIFAQLCTKYFIKNNIPFTNGE